MIAAAIALSACVKPAPRKAVQPMEWRGHTYTICQERIKRARAYEAKGVPTTAPTGAAKREFLGYITDTELLAFGEVCGRGGTGSGGSIGFLGAIAADIPPEVETQGDLAVDLYQDILMHRHSSDFAKAYVADGRFEEHMKLRRLVR